METWMSRCHGSVSHSARSLPHHSMYLIAHSPRLGTDPTAHTVPAPSHAIQCAHCLLTACVASCALPQVQLYGLLHVWRHGSLSHTHTVHALPLNSVLIHSTHSRTIPCSKHTCAGGGLVASVCVVQVCRPDRMHRLLLRRALQWVTLSTPTSCTLHCTAHSVPYSVPALSTAPVHSSDWHGSHTVPALSTALVHSFDGWRCLV
jgi:hypothetical protein